MECAMIFPRPWWFSLVSLRDRSVVWTEWRPVARGQAFWSWDVDLTKNGDRMGEKVMWNHDITPMNIHEY